MNQQVIEERARKLSRGLGAAVALIALALAVDADAMLVADRMRVESLPGDTVIVSWRIRNVAVTRGAVAADEQERAPEWCVGVEAPGGRASTRMTTPWFCSPPLAAGESGTVAVTLAVTELGPSVDRVLLTLVRSDGRAARRRSLRLRASESKTAMASEHEPLPPRRIESWWRFKARYARTIDQGLPMTASESIPAQELAPRQVPTGRLAPGPVAAAPTAARIRSRVPS